MTLLDKPSLMLDVDPAWLKTLLTKNIINRLDAKINNIGPLVPNLNFPRFSKFELSPRSAPPGGFTVIIEFTASLSFLPFP